MPFLAPILFLVTLFASSLTLANNNLPTLGNASSNIISIEKERQLGNAWLAALRGQVQTYEQPVVEQYLEQLVYSLAPYSAVADREFRFVVLNSPELNAFAVPGSVVGINAGLFLHASSEQEFASVIAHELAHLSQRHYARRLEQQQLSTPLTLAGVLASVVIAATTGAEAGIATLASTQALSVEKSLSYSRQNEEEADRIGIETMYASDYNPRAMPKMFERMLKNARLQGNTPPEYLSTHPLSENRVSDTRNRAEQYPVKPYQDSVLFHICKAIVTVDYAQSKEQAADLYKSIISRGKHKNVDAARFGLAYALLESDPSFS
ncbi:M48 family metalloprotease, partial [Oleiphilus sp. HI0080]